MSEDDDRIPRLIEAANQMQQGRFQVDLPAGPDDGLGRLGQALQGLAGALEARQREAQRLEALTARINAGLMLNQIMASAYEDFRQVIPYNRIGMALLENDRSVLRARWCKSDQPMIHLGSGYAASMAGSSLEHLLRTGQPRILNDLEAYYQTRPQSDSTRLILLEGMRSSLTCPLVANGAPVGFIFFSSVQPHTYADLHTRIFLQIAGALSLIVEKGRLVSELAEQKVAVEKQNQELRRLNEVKAAFLGMAAHDLRSPLGYLQTAVDFLRSEPAGAPPDPEIHRQTLDGMRRQVQHMLTLVSDLLDLTELETGKLNLQPQSVEVGPFLQEIVSQAAEQAAWKETGVVLEVAPAGRLLADPARLRQILENLISNAVKYSPPVSLVRVRAWRSPVGWAFSVQDQGPGIQEADRPQLFKPYARLSARPTKGEKSSGLGLAICKWLVEAHGGRIGVDTLPGAGARFWFTMPERLGRGR